MSTSVASLSTNFFPSAQNGFTTTTSGSVASGATAVGLNSVAGYSNGEIAVFVIDPSDTTKKQTFTGVIDTSGVQVTSVVWTAGTNQTHASGATVVDYETATHFSMISKGILVQHKQDGTHANTITTDTINENTSAAGVTIDGLLIKDNFVVGSATTGVNNASLSTAAGALGAPWATWSPTLGNLSGGTTTYAKYVQIGKTVFFMFKYTLAGAGVAGSASFSTPTTMNSSLTGVADPIAATVQFTNAGINAYLGQARWLSSTTITLHALGTGSVHETLSSTVPFTWGASDTLAVSGFYEAA